MKFRPGKEFGVAGSIMETWKTGWIEHMFSGCEGNAADEATMIDYSKTGANKR